MHEQSDPRALSDEELLAVEEQEDADERSVPKGPPTLKQRLVTVSRALVVLIVAAAVGYAMVSNWPDIVQTFHVLGWKSLLVTFLAIMASMLAGVKVWQHLLAAMGTEVEYVHAAEVQFVGNLAKYIPGSVWALVLQTQLGKRFKIPRARAFTALLLTAGMSIVTAATVGALAAPELVDAWGKWAWLLVAGPLSLVTLAPPVLTRIANVAIRAMRRLQLDANLRAKHVIAATLWSFVSWLFLGLHIWLLSGELARQTIGGYVLSVAAMALAMASGFIAFVLPSGIGVRELILIGGLAPIAAPQQALAIALASRILFTIADLACAALGYLASWVTLRRGNTDPTAQTKALSEHQSIDQAQRNS